METVILTFLVMLIVVLIMAIGYVLQKKEIKGSCGGISDLGLAKVCDCDEPCDKRKELLKKLERQELEEQKLEDGRISVTVIDN